MEQTHNTHKTNDSSNTNTPKPVRHSDTRPEEIKSYEYNQLRGRTSESSARGVVRRNLVTKMLSVMDTLGRCAELEGIILRYGQDSKTPSTKLVKDAGIQIAWDTFEAYRMDMTNRAYNALYTQHVDSRDYAEEFVQQFAIIVPTLWDKWDPEKVEEFSVYMRFYFNMELKSYIRRVTRHLSRFKNIDVMRSQGKDNQRTLSVLGVNAGAEGNDVFRGAIDGTHTATGFDVSYPSFTERIENIELLNTVWPLLTEYERQLLNMKYIHGMRSELIAAFFADNGGGDPSTIRRHIRQTVHHAMTIITKVLR